MPAAEVQLEVQPVPKDNSCLFAACAWLSREFDGDTADPDWDMSASAAALRSACAEEIRADPKYAEAHFDGKTKEQYAAWIERKESWGGEPEILLLADALRLELAIVQVAAGAPLVYAPAGGSVRTHGSEPTRCDPQRIARGRDFTLTVIFFARARSGHGHIYFTRAATTMFSRAPVAAAPSSRRETPRPTRQRLQRPQLPKRLVRPSCVSDAANAFDAPGAALCSLAIHAPSRRAQPEVSVASALCAVARYV